MGCFCIVCILDSSALHIYIRLTLCVYICVGIPLILIDIVTTLRCYTWGSPAFILYFECPVLVITLDWPALEINT